MVKRANSVNCKVSLSTVLWRYANKPFIDAQRARFVLILSIGVAVFMLILIAFSISLHLTSPENTNYIQTVSALFFSFFVYLVFAWFIVKGYAHLVSQLLVLYSFLLSWVIIFIDGSGPVGRLDNILVIFSAMSILPLLIDNGHYKIYIYSALNIAMSIVFISLSREDIGLSVGEAVEYLADVIVTVLFMGYVANRILTINKEALQKAADDYNSLVVAEEKVKDSEKKIHDIVEFFPQVIFEIDLKGHILFLNSTGRKLLGFDMEKSLETENVYDLLEESYIDLLSGRISSIQDKNRVEGFEYVMYNGKGELFDAKIYAGPILIDGVVKGVRGVMIDISMQKKAELALQKGHEMFRSIIENSPNPITITNMKGQLVLANKYFLHRFGFKEDDVVGKTYTELGLFFDLSSNDLLWHKLRTKGAAQNMEIEVKTHVNETIYIIYSCIMVDFLGEQMLLSSSVDITERKKIEVELEAYQKHLETLVYERTEQLEVANEDLSAANEEYAATNEELVEANEKLREQRLEIETSLNNLKNAQNQLVQSEKLASIGMLASGIAHEINNPLNYINGGIYGIEAYIRTNLGEHEKNLKPLVQAINSGVQRASEIVKGLGRYSRQSKNEQECCDVHAIVNDCLILLGNQTRNRIEVSCRFYPKPLLVLANEGRLHQAFLNILANAIQAIEGEGKVQVETDVFDNCYICIKISDTGCGIKKEDLAKIFDPFYTTKEPGRGTGLGLAITNEIINNINGSVSVISEVNKGTTIIIKLPEFINE